MSRNLINTTLDKATPNAPLEWRCASAGGLFFQAEGGIRDDLVTGVQTCALPICSCKRNHPCQRVSHPGRPVRLVSVKPPSLANAKYAQPRVGGEVGRLSCSVDVHRTCHSSSFSTVSQGCAG